MPKSGFLLVLYAAWAVHANAASSNLETQIATRLSGFHGKVSLFAKNLETGASFGVRENDPVRTASTIKLPIMIECFFEAQEGKLKWDEILTLPADEKVSGSGVLTEFSDNARVPIRDAMHLMIVVSDNTATNLVLNRITGDNVNARMQGLGLQQTRVMRNVLGDGNNLKPEPSGVTQEGAKPESKQWGLGRSSPREMVAMLEKLYRRELVTPAASDEMIAVLKRQQYHDGIARDFKGVTIASKSGALDHLRSDVGIVYSTRGPIAMAITVDGLPEIDWTNDNPGNLLISSLSEILINELGGKMTQAEQHNRIDYIELPAGEIKATKAFYAEVFGWQFTDYGPGYSSFQDGRISGGLTTEAKPGTGGPLVIVYSKDLESTLQNVKSKGGTITKPTFDFPGGRRFHFHDPAGNELAVWTDKKADGSPI